MTAGRLDFALLVTLDALLHEGTVSGAARRLGKSTPAVSHALARLRVVLGDPLLVRAGRSMVRSPRADALRREVRELVVAAERVLSPGEAFSPDRVDREFVIRATDHIVAVLGPALDRVLASVAPRAGLRILPNAPDDATALRDGQVDLAIGIYDARLAPEIRMRTLLTDRYVCVVRDGHPTVTTTLGLDEYLRLDHVQIAPRGRPGGYIDDVLASRGLARRVTRAVPYFLAGLLLVAESDAVITISERVANAFAERLRLRVVRPPLSLRPYALSMIWHPRFDADRAHALLRSALVEAARKAAPETHAGARTRARRDKLHKTKR